MSSVKKKMFSKRSVIITAVTAVLLIGIVLAFTGAFAALAYTNIKDNAIDETIASTSGTEIAVDDYFTMRLDALRNYAVMLSNADRMDEEELVSALSGLSRDDHFLALGFSVPGELCVNSRGQKEDVSDRGFIINSYNGIAGIYPDTFNDFTGERCDIYSVPVYRDGEVIGALTASTELFSFDSVAIVPISSIKGCYYLVSDSGKVINRTTEQLVDISTADDIRDSFAEKDKTLLNYYFNLSDAHEADYMTVNGMECAVSVCSLSVTDWSVVSVVPANKLIVSHGEFMPATIVLICIITVAIIAVATFLVLRMISTNKRIDSILTEKDKTIYIDSVTGYASWDSFKENYNKAMVNTGGKYALLSLDIDKFKIVNDALGYDGGNKVLKEFADIIKRNIGENDVLSRGSGDHFYVLYEYENTDGIKKVCNNIMTDVDYLITNTKCTISIGIFIIEDHRLTVRAATDRSDIARKKIKGHNESQYNFFDESMIEAIRSETSIESIMEDALEKREFKVYLQPKYSLTDSGVMTGAEALVRWQRDGEIIPPIKFIPIFEKNGFVVKLDLYMFREICMLQKKWKSLGYEPKVISVNMSRLHLHNDSFVDELAAICDEYGIETKYFELEITESVAYENMDIIAAVFAKIKKYGFTVSIDDFGTGYSSLNMLRNLPVDVLKIDRSFLTENEAEKESASHIIGCVVSLASALRIATICEGIETKEQAELLESLGCDMAQGYFFAKPMPVADYEKLAYGMKKDD